MITRKITITFILLLIFTFSNCCKKEKVTEHKEVTVELLNPYDYAKRIGSLKVQLLDLRSQKEFNQGHIENAVNINVLESGFVKKITTYKKDIPVYVYCTHGEERSEKAAKIFKEKGYVVTILEGGLDEWVKIGNRVIK